MYVWKIFCSRQIEIFSQWIMQKKKKRATDLTGNVLACNRFWYLAEAVREWIPATCYLNGMWMCVVYEE